jgi:DNA-binding PadR family transcriptional regulator
MPVKIGSLVKFYTILLLREGPKHGYDLMKGLEERLDTKISTSQVYPFLSILEKNGLIRISKFGEREKKFYDLTKKGKHFVNGFLQRSGDLLYIAVEPKLTTCAHCGCRVYEGGYMEKIGKRELAFCCQYCADSLKKEIRRR